MSDGGAGPEAIVDRPSIESEIEGIQARLKALHDELDLAQERLAEMLAREPPNHVSSDARADEAGQESDAC